LKAKCYTIGEYDLLGVEREPGQPAFALMAPAAMSALPSSTLAGKSATGSGSASRSTPGRRRRA
jgi:hypothetical protein